MKNKISLIIPAILAATILLSGCQAIGDIFKAGMWTGVIVVVLVIALVIFVVSKLFSKKD